MRAIDAGLFVAMFLLLSHAAGAAHAVRHRRAAVQMWPRRSDQRPANQPGAVFFEELAFRRQVITGKPYRDERIRGIRMREVLGPVRR